MHLYGRRDLKRLEIWLARLGIPTLTLWIGSDVVLHAPFASRAFAERSWHWCVASWLRDELTGAGIEAEVVRITPPHVPHPAPALPPRFAVLAYALQDRGELYGLEFVLELASRRPDIQFFLLGATPAESLPANVAALGWVGDMDAVMARTTIYVRPTAHDGLSNLVLEALANGRYVMWTYPFPGADAVDTVDAAEARLNELHRQYAEGRLSPNTEGRAAVIEMFDPVIVREQLLQGLTAIVDQGWRRPPGRARRWIAHMVLQTLRVTLGADRAWAGVEA